MRWRVTLGPATYCNRYGEAGLKTMRSSPNGLSTRQNASVICWSAEEISHEQLSEALALQKLWIRSSAAFSSKWEPLLKRHEGAFQAVGFAVCWLGTFPFNPELVNQLEENSPAA